jgi:filamentous hemagglutinin
VFITQYTLNIFLSRPLYAQEDISSQYSPQHPLNNIVDNPIEHIVPDNEAWKNNNGNINNNCQLNNSCGATALDRSQNGTPLIHINSPSEGWVSVNYYRDFNVNEENLIFNNHQGLEINTNLGGVIYGNPNFNLPNTREANIILNEITTNRQTKIEGYTEIAWKESGTNYNQPNDIMVSGGGFINTSRLSLINGSTLNNPNGTLDNNGNLNPFLLSNNPNSIITVTGRNVTDKNGNPIAYNLGIDANNINYVDLISRIVEINGNIQGDDNTIVTIQTGNDRVEYNKDDTDNRFTVTSYSNNNTNNNTDNTNNNNQETKPEFAIDSTAFGGIYAGRINIIATEDGVGVRTRSDLASSNDIMFDVNGNIMVDEGGNIYAKNNVNMKTTDTLNNEGFITANNDINIEADNNIINKGYIQSMNNLTLKTNAEINEDYKINDTDTISGGDGVDNNNINNNNTNNTNNNNGLLYIDTGELNNITYSQTEEVHKKSKNFQYDKIETCIGDTAEINSGGDIIINTVRVDNSDNNNNLNNTNNTNNNTSDSNTFPNNPDSSYNTNELLIGLNRDVNNSQQTTKDMITRALDGSMTVDNRLFTEDGRKNIKDDFKNLHENALIVLNDVSNIPLVGPIWWSHYIDNNNTIEITDKQGNKKQIDLPQSDFDTGDPNNPIVGINNCSGVLCPVISAQSPLLKPLNNSVPGFAGFAAWHDNNMDVVEVVVGTTITTPVKPLSIPAYIPLYYYGAMGTYLERGINNLKK